MVLQVFICNHLKFDVRCHNKLKFQVFVPTKIKFDVRVRK